MRRGRRPRSSTKNTTLNIGQTSIRNFCAIYYDKFGTGMTISAYLKNVVSAMIERGRFSHIRERTTTRQQKHWRLIELLIQERKRAGLRQIDLANAMKRTQGWVARLESGDRQVKVFEFLAVARVVGFDACDLLRKIEAL